MYCPHGVLFSLPKWLDHFSIYLSPTEKELFSLGLIFGGQVVLFGDVVCQVVKLPFVGLAMTRVSQQLPVAHSQSRPAVLTPEQFFVRRHLDFVCQKWNEVNTVEFFLALAVRNPPAATDAVAKMSNEMTGCS